MLDRILEKLGFDSLESFFENEKAIREKYKNMEIERKNPLLVLDFDELDFVRNYITEHNI